ncbi:hypothetical protein F5I97DRAFT_1640731 [Phlebopus sp. FC_14]|nr:hypothetical protein F5I97DRAFT_1640731 [Phlebopus sp. FC_14]
MPSYQPIQLNPANWPPAKAPTLKLHSVDLSIWDDGLYGDSLFLESLPDELDEPWPYRFKSGDAVWVRTGGDEHWYHAKVVGQPKAGKTRQDDGLYWLAEYHHNRRVRNWFAPLNGDIKPDTPHTRQLLEDAGWLNTEDTDESG